MKKNNMLTILLTGALILALVLTSCASKPETLEEYVSKNPDVKEQIDSAAETSGLDVTIEGNEVIYSYDLASIEGATKESLSDEAMLSTLNSSLASMGPTFAELCSNIEGETGLTGIKMTVNYTYEGEVLLTKTFTSADNADA